MFRYVPSITRCILSEATNSNLLIFIIMSYPIALSYLRMQMGCLLYGVFCLAYASIAVAKHFKQHLFFLSAILISFHITQMNMILDFFISLNILFDILFIWVVVNLCKINYFYPSFSFGYPEK